MTGRKDDIAVNESRGRCLRCGTILTPADNDDDDAPETAPEGRSTILSGMPMADLLDALTQDTQWLVERGAKGWGDQQFRSLRDVAAEIAARLS